MGQFKDTITKGKYSSILNCICNFAEGIATIGMKHFPYYTLHGKEHWNSIIRILDEFLLREKPLDDDQVFLLAASVYLHDIGMFLPAENSHVQAANELHQNLEGYLRDTHNIRINDFLKNNFQFLMSIEVTEGQMHTIRCISQGHRADIRNYADTKRILAALLKIGDALDIGPERTPYPALQTHLPNMNLAQQYHWLKHHLTDKWQSGVNVYYRINLPCPPRRVKIHEVTFQVQCCLQDKDLCNKLQSAIIAPIQKTLEEQNVHRILLTNLQLDIKVESGVIEEMEGGNPIIAGIDITEVIRRYLSDIPPGPIYPNASLQRYLKHILSNFQRIEVYSPLPVPMTSDIEEVFVEMNATQHRFEEEEDRIQKSLYEIIDNPQLSFKRQVELQVIGPISRVLEMYNRVILLGIPGIGKTIFLKYLALIYAKSLLNSPDIIKIKLKLDDRTRLPIFISLQEFADWLGKSTYIGEKFALLLKYIEEYLRDYGCEGAKDQVKTMLQNGECILLFDGLDEVGTQEGRIRICKIINDFTRNHPNNRYIVASRSLPDAILNCLGEGYYRATIVLLTDQGIEEFINKWGAVIESALKTISPSHKIPVPSQLLVLLHTNQRIKELARNPLMLIVMLMLYYAPETKEFNTRRELYKHFIELLLQHWDSTGHQIKSPAPIQEMYNYIEYLASWMHKSRKKEITWDEFNQVLGKYFEVNEGYPKYKAKEKAKSIILFWTDRPGLFIKRKKSYAFFHFTFQEYLVASYLSCSDDPFYEVRDKLEDDFWRGVILLTTSCLFQSSIEKAVNFVQNIIDIQSIHQKYHNLTLAGECLLEAGLLAPSIQICDQIRKRLLDAMMDESVDVRERIVAGNILGKIGDPRFELIEPEMITIPPGEFLMGSNDEEIEPFIQLANRERLAKWEEESLDKAWEIIRSLYNRETPKHIVNIPAFEIAKYPVTNQQYKHFIDDTGYTAPYRDKDWAEPYNWHNNLYPSGKANHPVVLVSYKDAVEYCKWLSGKTKKSYRLPTEAEWEKAARGTDGRICIPGAISWT